MLETPLAEVQIDALRQWLTRLETKLAEGLVNPVMVGLDNWTIKIREYITLEKRGYTANSAPLETRREFADALMLFKPKH